MSEDSEDKESARRVSVSITGVDDITTIDGADLEKVVDRDLKKFAKFYKETLGNAELSGFETAVIKTYLWWKTHDVADTKR